MPVRIARLIAEADRALLDIEEATINRIWRELKAAERSLEQEIATRYRQARLNMPGSPLDHRAVAEARARELLNQVRGNLEAFDVKNAGHPIAQEVRTAAEAAYRSGLNTAGTLLHAYDDALTMTVGMSSMNLRMVTENAATRLHRHSLETITRIESAVMQGLIRGEGYIHVARRVREATGIMQNHAETIARTETISASDEARRKGYEDVGIAYVQRVATQDSRICPYCAARAGNVYKLSEAPAALHPNDRCFNAPWKPGWQADGLTNDEWVRNHRTAVEEKLKKEGIKPNHGRAPFEKMNDEKRPKPIWTPRSGYTSKWGRPAARA